jgi:dienelactone hydrolase
MRPPEGAATIMPDATNRLSRRALIAAPALGAGFQSARSQTASPVAAPEARFDFFNSLPAAYDDRFMSRIDNLPPGQMVTIEAVFSDAAYQTWRSEATYLVPDYGTISPVAHTPVSGTFDVADQMAFIWSATTESPRPFYFPPTHDSTIAFTVLAEDGVTVLAHQEITRSGLPEDATFETIDGPEFRAEYVAPSIAGNDGLPAVMILGGSEGGIYTLQTATWLAAHGYACLCVGYFAMEGLPDQLENIPLEYFAGPIEWLRQRPEIDSSRIGVLGYSRGAELALLLATRYDDLTAAVSISGSGVVHPGIDWSDLNREFFPAWTWNGTVIPFLDSGTVWGDPDTYAEATIPVETINGPVLLVGGEDDMLWPTILLSQVSWNRLQDADRNWPDQFLSYPGAGHYIFPPYQPTTYARELSGLPIGGNPRDDATAAAGSWQAILAMLDGWRLHSDTA